MFKFVTKSLINKSMKIKLLIYIVANFLLIQLSSQNTTSLNNKSNTFSFESVKIGNQIWMSKNLDVTKFRNGDIIPEAKTKQEWENAGKQGSPAWCYYENSIENGKIYGKLYNWHAINDPRGLAPEGWEIPTYNDWFILRTFCGDWFESGIKLKSISGWEIADKMYKNDEDYLDQNNILRTNETGFSAIPGGTRNLYGDFSFKDYVGFYWTSTSAPKNDAFYSSIDHSSENRLSFGDRNQGMSVRCIKKLPPKKVQTIVDARDGKTYKIALIGTQTWMSQNMNFEIKNESWCYHNQESKCNNNGRLYNWSSAQKACPEGWKLPSKADYETLLNYLYKNYGENASSSFFLSIFIEGESGFDAQFAGRRNTKGFYELEENTAYWWTSDKSDNNIAWRLMLDKIQRNASLFENNIETAFSVRCIKE